MKLNMLILSLFACFNVINAQNYLEITDNDSIQTKEERLQLMIKFMSTINFETCADIGSGNLEYILAIADTFYEKTFVLEDIDSSLCNWSNMINQINIFNLHNIDTNKLKIHMGDTISTRLPDHQFDLVILSALIHELNAVDEFFADIKRILKPTGTIIISDSFYEQPPKPHQSCNNRFLTHSEMEQLITQQHLHIIKEWRRVGIKTKKDGPYMRRLIQCSFN